MVVSVSPKATAVVGIIQRNVVTAIGQSSARRGAPPGGARSAHRVERSAGAAASAGEPRRACRDGALSIGRPVLGYSYGDTTRRRKQRFVIPVVSWANSRDWLDVTRRCSTQLPTRKARLVAVEAERMLLARAVR